MTESPQPPGKLKKWSERFALVSAIVTVLGLTVSGVLSVAWQSVWNYFDPPLPTKTRLVAFDPWLAPDAVAKAKAAGVSSRTADCMSSAYEYSIPHSKRCFINRKDNILEIGDPCYEASTGIDWDNPQHVVACVHTPWRETDFVRVKKAPSDIYRGPVKNKFSPGNLLAFTLGKDLDRCHPFKGGTVPFFSGRPAIYRCDRGFTLSLRTSDTLWSAEYVRVGKPDIEWIPIETAWF